MILSAFTLFHVLLSLAGIGSGFVVLAGLLASKRLDGWTKFFLITTVATSVTGYFFPVQHITPGHIVGAISLVLLAIAIRARYHYGLAGAWRRTYVITAIISLYLNVFVLIVQLFQKVPAMKAIAPTQTELPFQMAQLTALVFFTAVTIRAAIKFHNEPLNTA